MQVLEADSISSGSVRVSNGKITLIAETHLPNGGEVLPVSSPLPLVPPSIAPGLEPILYQQADTLRWYTFFLLDMQTAVFEAMALPSQGRPTYPVWTDLTMMRPRANATKDPKFLSVFSQRSAMRLKRLSLPTRCSMRARAR